MNVAKALERHYPTFPLPIQNLLISGQGYLFKKQRFANSFDKRLRESIRRTKLSTEEFELWRLAELKRFLQHAYDNSPYWSRTMRAAGFEPSSMTQIACIRGVPILEKSILREQIQGIFCPVFADKKLVKVHTSGTTGSPISLAFTYADMQQRMAYLFRMFAMFGISHTSKSVRFSGRTLFPNAANNRIFWRYNKPMNQMLMSSYDLHPANFANYVAQLERYAPEVMDGYPSSFYVLAKYINAEGLSGTVRPKVIMTTAETLEYYQRDEIERAFGGCPVINQYASSEGAPFITQDRGGELVINEDTGIFEFVRPGTDEPAGPGEIAEMLLTSFTTHAYPLIRYRIGDTVLLPNEERRSRDWKWPVVEQIMGRQEGVLFTPERGYVGRLDPVFKKAPMTILECQIVQTGPMAITLRVVPDKTGDYATFHLDGIKEELWMRLGNVEIEVEELDELSRGANGKLAAVINLVPNEVSALANASAASRKS